ncbi:cell division protein FtsZ [Pseudooceanicola algae]|uniref:Cell division protein FtsZ n=1 Tax=Pseudooceanicola algae TaxID=1537215 RepID=A0A418SFI8_9RHOB|nr:cell division protein FtsZ [Pseudooceanicola algae]QPM89228.1 Cell division protein FtsZ [Pseudooceanicola algae]
MTLNLSVPGQGEELKPRITVFGVGGAGGNAVNNMIDQELEGVDFVVANTDAQALQQSRASQRVQLGIKVTEGLGAGAKPSVGMAAAEESIETIVDHLAGAHMCFITAGMGGGTGTGAAPIIAQAAREMGVLTVGVVTKPFQFEGSKRMRQAEEGVEALQKMVDTLIIIPNQNLFRLANEKTTFTEAFAMADDVLYQGVKGVTDLMVRPGLINLDFADVRAVMDEMGKAMMGTGEAEGENRAIQAAEKAIANPLLDEISLRGAKGVLINITGAHDLTLFELDEAANRIREEVDPDANIIVGSTLDETMEGRMRVSVVATGIDAAEVVDVPAPRRTLAEPLKTPQQVEEATARTVAAQPARQPLVAEQPEPVAEAPSLFDRQDAQPEPSAEAEPFYAARSQPAAPQPAPRADYAPRAAARPAAQDDMPPPAYRPHAEQAAPRRHGEPSQDTMARLQAAVTHRPAGGGQQQPAQQHAARQAAPQGQGNQYGQPQPTQQAPRRGEGEKPRFGINSLINRMTGHGEGEESRAPAQRPQPSMRAEEPARHAPQAAPRPAHGGGQGYGAAPGAQRQPQVEEDDQDRIEIPAFLRRQAN